MSKVKDNLLHFLKKVESGDVTAQDIHNAQSILNSSVIIPSSSVLRKGNTRIRLRHRVGFTPALKDMLQSNEYYTVQEVAQRFNVTDKAVYKWIKQNKIEWERTSQNSRDIRIPKNQFKSPPAKAEASDLEKSIFNDAVEMELVKRQDLYRDED
ncbi:helix-turn-helix domain-containing protein [Paenibacillus sp. FSL L8-0436]|uniref:helix-turn-helix domain-containing protein n=1 Tax=Paenibacillus sp. FSL L8-0436 TaxID=2954686 RepID=UPI00315921E9